MTFAGYKKMGVGFAAILLITPFFVFAAGANDIAITEIAYDLKGADDGHEWVEIQNTIALEIDLTGWKFSDGANHLLNLPPKNGGQGTLAIPAGGYAVLADDAAVFLSDHPGFAGTVIDTVMSLNNTAATLAILDKDGAIIDSVAYQKEWGANGNGLTLEKNGTWKESAQEGGTPGTPNSALSPTGENATSTDSVLSPQSSSGASGTQPLTAAAGDNIAAIVNKDVFFDGSKSKGGGILTFLWNFGDGMTKEGQKVLHRYLFPGSYIVTLTVSAGGDSSESQLRADVYPDNIVVSEFFPNPPGGEPEWVELNNRSSYGADISGWGIGVKDSAPAFKIPENTFLPGRSFLVLSKDATKISLPGTSGGIYLFYPDNQVAGKIEYKNAPKDMSASLDQNGQFVWTGQKTPGGKNIVVSSAAPEKNIEAANVSKNNKAIALADKTRPLFVEYKKYGGVKSFIAEPAFAYTIAEPENTPQNAGDGNLPGEASLYGAFSRIWFWALAAGVAVVLFLIFRKRSGAK